MSLLTAVDIFNAACARIGEDPVQSFDDDDFGGQTASLIYEETVDFNLGIYRFSWSMEMRQLSRLTNAQPLTGWTKVFDLPPERLGPPLYLSDDITDPDRRFTRYTLTSERVHSDAEPLFAMIRFRPDPPRWSPPFRTATITALASKLAMASASDRTTMETLHQQAYGTPSEAFRGGQMGAAIRDDAHSTPPRRAGWENNPLSKAWRGG